ncbi:MAG: hypothetical protein E7001_02985 [Coriobacteriaceae bacterium]|nr:hypothetical protein [Coriobacteriaceae bacterium]
MSATDDALARIEALKRAADEAERAARRARREAGKIEELLGGVRAEGFAEAVGIVRRRIGG